MGYYTQPETYFSLLKKGVAHLRTVSTEAVRETELLFLHAFNMTKAVYLSRLHDRVTSKSDTKLFWRMIDDRLRGRPVAYILGEAGFMAHTYFVAEGVLIPRPETELLVQECQKLIAQDDQQGAGWTILELGFGSGVISIELKLSCPKAQVWAWDISSAALKVAQDNARNLNVSGIHWIEGDFFLDQATWMPMMSAPKVLVVSNPPYIPSADIETLDPIVKHHEPREALDGGADGLDFYRQLFKILRPGNHFAVEFGIHQKGPLQSLIDPLQPVELQILDDLAGIPRVMVGQISEN